TGIHCSVLSLPHEAYSPSRDSGWWLDLHEAQRWVDMAISRMNHLYEAGINPTPLSSWIGQGFIPAGTFYPPSRLCFWLFDDIQAFWQRLEQERRRKRARRKKKKMEEGM